MIRFECQNETIKLLKCLQLKACRQGLDACAFARYHPTQGSHWIGFEALDVDGGGINRMQQMNLFSAPKDHKAARKTLTSSI